MTKDDLKRGYSKSLIQKRNENRIKFDWPYNTTDRNYHSGYFIDRVNLFVKSELVNPLFYSCKMRDVTVRKFHWGWLINLHHIENNQPMILQIYRAISGLFFQGFFNSNAFHGDKIYQTSTLIRFLGDQIHFTGIELAIDLPEKYFNFDVVGNIFHSCQTSFYSKRYLTKQSKDPVILYNKKEQLRQKKNIEIKPLSLWRLEYRLTAYDIHQLFPFSNMINNICPFSLNPQKMFYFFGQYIRHRNKCLGIDHNIFTQATPFPLINEIFNDFSL